MGLARARLAAVGLTAVGLAAVGLTAVGLAVGLTVGRVAVRRLLFLTKTNNLRTFLQR